MAFSQDKVAELLARCHRRCCICHKFAGVKMETAHIEPDNDDIENAIPVCFECHAEIGLYNPRHPKGRRFSANELRKHRKQWLDICENKPEILLDPIRAPNPGSLERLLNELEFNERVAQELDANKLGCLFETGQFERALADGTLTWLDDRVVQQIQAAYIRMKSANTHLRAFPSIGNPNQRANASEEAQTHAEKAKEAIQDAIENVRSALQSG